MLLLSEDPVPTHDDSVRALQVALTDAKSKIAATLMAETKKSKKNNKSAAMLRPAHIHANEVMASKQVTKQTTKCFS